MDVIDEKRRCVRCEQVKPLDAFSKDSRGRCPHERERQEVAA